jgi:hypothetical protein
LSSIILLAYYNFREFFPFSRVLSFLQKRNLLFIFGNVHIKIKRLYCAMLEKIFFILFTLLVYVSPEPIEEVRITIQELQLSHVLYGSTESATLACSDCWPNRLSVDPDDEREGSLCLNGYGNKFISFPKKMYRFTDRATNSTLVFMNLIEPGQITTFLTNELTEKIGGIPIPLKHVELFINDNYNGLYLIKTEPETVSNRTHFKIDIDQIPDNSRLLSNLSIEAFDQSLSAFSQIITLFDIRDTQMHNYIIYRTEDEVEPFYSISCWDSDLCLGTASKSPVNLDVDFFTNLQTIFNLNRLQETNVVPEVETWATISSSNSLYRKIDQPLDLELYENAYAQNLATGPLTVANMSRQIDLIIDRIADAAKRDNLKWKDYYCPGNKLFSIDVLKQNVEQRHGLITSALSDTLVNVDPVSDYKYCTYMREPNAVVMVVATLAIAVNVYYRQLRGTAVGVCLLFCYLLFNRLDLADPAPILGTFYLARFDLISLLLIYLLLGIFSRRKNSHVKCILLSYSIISIVLSILNIIETAQLTQLSKINESVSSTGKIIIDFNMFDGREEYVFFILYIYWKVLCQIALTSMTLQIPSICGYSSDTSHRSSTLSRKKVIITRFIYANIVVFIGALLTSYSIWPPNLTRMKLVIQIINGIISNLILFNLRCLYTILKWSFLKYYRITDKNINAIMSNRNKHNWNLDALLKEEQNRISNRTLELPTVSVKKKYATNVVVNLPDEVSLREEEEIDTSVIQNRLRISDAFPKKLSHMTDGLIVFILSVQSIDSDNNLESVYTYSSIIIFIQMIIYLISYSNNGKFGFVMYGSKARIMDGNLGRENEIFGWLCDKMMLPCSIYLERVLRQNLSDQHILPISFIIFMPIIIGDAFGELVGSTIGKQKIQVWGLGEHNKKSVEGTLAVFVSSLICAVGAVIYYEMRPISYLLAIIVSSVSTILELYSPRSTDNIFMLLGNLSCCLLFASQFDL